MRVRACADFSFTPSIKSEVWHNSKVAFRFLKGFPGPSEQLHRPRLLIPGLPAPPIGQLEERALIHPSISQKLQLMFGAAGRRDKPAAQTSPRLLLCSSCFLSVVAPPPPADRSVCRCQRLSLKQMERYTVKVSPCAAAALHSLLIIYHLTQPVTGCKSGCNWPATRGLSG